MDIWKSFFREGNTNKQDPAKVFDSFESIFKHPHTMELLQRSLQIQTAKEEKFEQLDIWMTNVFLTCGYQRLQLDNKKVRVLFNSTEYFKIKHYIIEKTHNTYQALLDKCKVHERSLIY